METKRTDVLIVGAGIIGLAHAFHAARSGHRVTVIERTLAATGASIANFGMLWPIGQTAGTMLDLALSSRSIWLDVLQDAKIPFRSTGSLHVACHEDEAEVGR